MLANGDLRFDAARLGEDKGERKASAFLEPLFQSGQHDVQGARREGDGIAGRDFDRVDGPHAHDVAGHLARMDLGLRRGRRFDAGRAVASVAAIFDTQVNGAGPAYVADGPGPGAGNRDPAVPVATAAADQP